MITVSCNNVNIYSTYGIILEHFEIGMPDPKVVKVPIPGRDGDLDMSTALTGFVHYGNRVIQLQFGIVGEEQTIETKRIQLLSLIAGQYGTLSFSHLPGFFRGRFLVKSITRELYHYTVLVEVDCEPYRYEITPTTITQDLTSTSKNLIIQNTQMPTSPTITTTANATIIFNKKTYSLTKGSHQLGFFFSQGMNTLSVSGSGTMTITFQKGVL